MNSIQIFSTWLEQNPWILIILALWIIPWKGVALWKAAQLSSKKWFIVLLVLNTLAILDIIYIFFIAPKYTMEVKEDISKQV